MERQFREDPGNAVTIELFMTDPERKQVLLAYAALTVGIVCIGCSAIFVKIAATPGIVSAFYRLLFAAVVVVPWGIWRRTPARRPTTRQVLLVAAGGIFFALDLAVWNTSILLTSAATATLLANNATLWVGLGALFLFREHLSLRYWSGLAIAIAGMAVLLGAASWHTFHWHIGELLAIAASFFYASYLLTVQRARQNVDTLTFMAISHAAGVGLLLVLNLAGGSRLTGYSARSWLALIAMGLISQLLGWLAINYAIGHLRAAPVSVTLLGQVVVTALLSIPILGELPSTHQVVGGVVVLTGIYLANQRNRKGDEPAPSRYTACAADETNS